MRDTLSKSLRSIKWFNVQRTRLSAVLSLLSLVVCFGVFWALRQPGWTLAGDADCGITEHTHTEACYRKPSADASKPDSIYGISGDVYPLTKSTDSSWNAVYNILSSDVNVTGSTNPERELICRQAEHKHSISCYSDETADVETPLDWQEMFADYPYTGNLREDLVGIALTQVGYTESALNFEVGSDGIRRGYTRYGAWYGTPYRDWSAMFVSFCLNYAGADSQEAPGNTGAASMATLWQNLDAYAPVGEYTPTAGDLVFFTNNTVGIVSEVQSSSFYVIRGDADNAVRGEILSLADESISGWGITNEKASTMAKFSLRNIATLTPINFSVLNKDETPLENATAYIGINYDLTVRFYSDTGFAPGTYQYQLPTDIQITDSEENHNGAFTLLRDGTEVGGWTVDDTGLLTIVLYEEIANYNQTTISAPMEIQFTTVGTVIFEGSDSLTIQVIPMPTVLEKWIEQEKVATDPTKLYWKIHIIGNNGSHLPGNTVSDQILSGSDLGTHLYTESDKTAGIVVGASHYIPGEGTQWYSWTLHEGDDGLSWTDTQWTYTLPTEITAYGSTVQLGNEGWEYYFEYTSTPTDSKTLGYMNRATADNQTLDVWYAYPYQVSQGELRKTGTFRGDAAGGSFYWELQATIPGRQPGRPADKGWMILDYLEVVSTHNNVVDWITNDADKSTVTAHYHGEDISVPHIVRAYGTEPFAWNNAWPEDHDGVNYGQHLDLLCRCDCTEETCALWGDGGCATRYWFYVDGQEFIKNYCTCWNADEAATITFAYETKDLSLAQTYGGMSYLLRNRADLYQLTNDPNAAWGSYWITGASAAVEIPKLLSKTQIGQFDGWSSKYRITINDALMPLPSSVPITIRDEMSDNMVFISGSLVITTEDANGNTTTLQQGEDFAVTYDGTGQQTDENHPPVHVMKVEIFRPQTVKYTLDYETTLIIPVGTTGEIAYSNTAILNAWGTELIAAIEERYVAAYNISDKSYQVALRKTDTTGNKLPGATFGLFNEQGGLIATDDTDEDGSLFFKTDFERGILFKEHALYYLQELSAPPGYQLDNTEHWFCFCSHADQSCADFNAVTAGTNALRIPFGQTGTVYAVNEPVSYDLPATGGPGITPLILMGVICITTPLVYGSIRRRKQERRGVA